MDGTPVSSGSIDTASRSARASALNAASTMWWVLVPALDAHVQGELGRVGHGAQELLEQVGVEVGDRLGRERHPPATRTARPGHVERAGGARLVHRHHGVAVAADARRGRRAPRPARARARCRCPPRCGAGRSRRSPSTATSRSSRPWRASASSRWSKKPTPVERSPDPSPSSASDRRMSVSEVVRVTSAVRVTPGAPSTRRVRESPRRVRARRRAGPGGRRRPRASDTRAIRRRNVDAREGRLEASRAARWAARGWSRPRSRRRRWRPRCPRTRSRRGSRGRQAPRLSSRELEVLGSEGLGHAQRLAHAGGAQHHQLGVAARWAGRRPCRSTSATT